MLHSFAFSNFQSFRDRSEVSLSLNGKVPDRGWEMTSPSGERLTTSLAIFGANGAGKTALLKPVAFADWFIRHSFAWPAEQRIPVAPHFACSDQPVEVEFIVDDAEGQVWKYELVLNQERVLHEALYRKNVRFNYVFSRTWDVQHKCYDVKQKGFGFAAREAARVRENASLISTAAQYGVEQAVAASSLLNVYTNIDYFGRLRVASSDLEEASSFFVKIPEVRSRMVSLLKSWDLGLDDVKIEKHQKTRSNGKTTDLWRAFGIHRVKEGSFKLDLELESSGTQSAFLLLYRILPALAVGGIALIDEMEADLHPLLTESILDMFSSAEVNPKGAQIIFTCHSPSVLNILQKTQVIFVEKAECASEQFRGDEIQGLRSDDNLRAKYESGAIGATPRF